MRKQLLLALIALLIGFQTVDAMPAHPGKYKVVQPDGSTLVLQQHGDEWGHWLTDASGQMVRKGDDGFYRVVSTAEAADVRKQVASSRDAIRDRQAQQMRLSKSQALGSLHFLVILVEFEDKTFSVENPRQAFSDLLNEPGYSLNGATGSARDYYYENSHGLFEPIFDVYGPVQLENPYSYYGKNKSKGIDRFAGKAVAEGCRGLDDQIDFSQYDNDGDGKVDMVFMYYAGYGEADSEDENTIWPKMNYLLYESIDLTLDGMKLDLYACTNEIRGSRCEHPDWMTGIGAACHEFAHVMGLPDLYDTDGNSGGYAGGLYTYSILCDGMYNNDSSTPPYFNFEERLLLGWVHEDDFRVFGKTGDFSIPPVNGNVAYRTFMDVPGEYFVYENRAKTGWDRYIPEEGMIVYHVDRSSNAVTSAYTAGDLWKEYNIKKLNAINAIGNHPCFYVIPAADQQSLLYCDGLIGDHYIPKKDGYAFPYGSIDSFTSRSWSGARGRTTLSQIAFSDGMVTLHADVPESHLDYLSIVQADSYRVGNRFTFNLNCPDGVNTPASVEWYFDDELVRADSITLTAGAHTIDARLAFSDGSKAVLSLEIDVTP
jgi:M6 family metalloprotease-like protein